MSILKAINLDLEDTTKKVNLIEMKYNRKNFGATDTEQLLAKVGESLGESKKQDIPAGSFGGDYNNMANTVGENGYNNSL